MESLQMETFLEQRQPANPADSKCDRVIRKKFRCIILFMLTIIVSSQVLIILFDKIDEKYLNKFFEVITSNSSFLAPLLDNAISKR
jgi:uncharacterized PurR-regulated membrane protein YhhQ (DUF165 family)